MTAALQIKETDWTATTAYYARYFSGKTGLAKWLVNHISLYDSFG